MTRSMMRGASALAASAAVAAGLLLLSGCGAGQVTQTENQSPPVSGVNVQSADGNILLRNVTIAYKGSEGYASGSSAPLRLRVVNQNQNTVRLIGVESDLGTVVVAGPGALPSASATPPAPPSSAPAASSAPASGAASPSGSGSASPGASGSVSASTSPTPTGPATNPTIDIEIATRALVVLDTSGQRYLEITGLREGLRPGQTAEFTFRFDNGVTITTQVPIEVPMSPLPRSPLEMDEEGHA